MTISLRNIAGDDGSTSMRAVASDHNLTYDEFTLRELITPQYRTESYGPYGEEWHNWVGDHAGERTVHAPQTKADLVAAIVNEAYDNPEGRIRAVGSGHSHSNAPAPPEDVIILNVGLPGGVAGPELGEPKDRVSRAGDLGLTDVLSHNGWLKDDVDTEYLRRLQGGVLLRRLNRFILHDNGYALKNMGSFDGQTISGAINTSTHGTGRDLASVSDSVKSVEIATVPESESGDPIVRLYRIEPSDGITDREAFEAETGSHEMELIQDDDIFHSVVVGYGCMGVAYAYTLEVRDTYWLWERSGLMSWNTVENNLGSSAADVRNWVGGGGRRHFQILVNTAAMQSPFKEMPAEDHQINDNPLCLVRAHREVPDEEVPSQPADWDDRWPPERQITTGRDIAKMFGNDLHPLKPNKVRAKQLHNKFFHKEAENAPFVGDRRRTVWYAALRRLPDRAKNGNDKWYHPRPPLPTPTVEVAVPLDQLKDAVNAVLQKVKTIKQDTPIPNTNIDVLEKDLDVFFMLPMGLRFTAPSEHFLSPEFERETAMIEVPLPVNHDGADATLRSNVPSLSQEQLREYVVEPALEELEALLVEEFDGRPHMGKHNTMDAEQLAEKYPYFDASDDPEVDVGWYQAYERFNAFGTFDNKFTEQQLGLDEFTPAYELEPAGDGPAQVAETSAGTEAGGDGMGLSDASGSGFGFLAGLAGAGAGAWWLTNQSEDGAEATSGDRAADPSDASGSADPADPDDAAPERRGPADADEAVSPDEAADGDADN